MTSTEPTVQADSTDEASLRADPAEPAIPEPSQKEVGAGTPPPDSGEAGTATQAQVLALPVEEPPVPPVAAEAAPPEVAPPELAAAVSTAAIEALSARISELVGQVERTNRFAETREKIIDRLHEENQRLKAGELQQALAPVLRDLVRLFDDLDRATADYARKEAGEPREMARDLGLFRDLVADLLYRQGLERFDASAGAPFDPKTQRAVGIIPTASSAQDRTVVRVIHPGFRSDTKVFRPVEAEVFRFDPKLVPPDPPPAAPTPTTG